MSEEESMKKATLWITGLALVAALVIMPGYAQKPPAPGSKEALAVLDKLIEALGGRKALEAIKDMTISGTAEIVQYGLTVPVTIYQKEPNKVRVDVTIAEANMTIIQAYDGQKGWYTNPQSGATEEMPEFMAKEIARQAGESQALLHPVKAGMTYALKPKEALEGKDYVVLERTAADGHKTTMYLDPETFLPYKVAARTIGQDGSEVDSETFSTNYQKTGGMMIAFAMRTLQNGAETQRVTVTAVSTNANLDDAFFTLK
jgi:zinc protease